MAKSMKKPKNSYRHGDLKSSIISLALSEIKKTNKVDFTLRELANQLGVTHASVYRHFKSKIEILYAIAEEGFSLLNDKFILALKKNPKDIVSIGVAYVEFAIRHPDHFKVMFHPDLKIDGSHPRLANFGAKTFSYLHECVKLNVESGNFREQNIEELAVAAWSIVHGLAVLAVNGSLNPLPNGIAFQRKDTSLIVANIIMHGLLVRK